MIYFFEKNIKNIKRYHLKIWHAETDLLGGCKE